MKAFLALFCASPYGTLTYLTVTLGCFAVNASAIFWKLAFSASFEVSHHVTVPVSSPPALVSPLSFPLSPLQAVAASARAATSAVAAMPRRI